MSERTTADLAQGDSAAEAGRRFKLLVLSSTYPRWPNDPEPGFVHELNRRLASHFDVVALVPSARGAKRRERIQGVDVVRFRYAPSWLEVLVNDGGIVNNLRRSPWKYGLVPLFLLSLSFELLRLRLTWRPDVIHAHWLIPQGLIAGLLRLGARRTPILVTCHGAYLFGLRGRVMSSIKRWVFSRVSHATVVSQGMLKFALDAGASGNCVTVQPMGVDLANSFTPVSEVERRNDELLFVGRLVEKKGLRYLIEAFAVAIGKRPSLSLTIAGFGPDEDELRRQVGRLGIEAHVQFLGAVRQAELPGLYRRAALFVAPFVEAASGDQEGLGLVVVEAMGCGCPVIVSDLPATRELPLCDSFRFAPANVKQLAERIDHVLGMSRSDREMAIAAAREELVSRYDWSTVGKGYARLIKDLARPRDAGQS